MVKRRSEVIRISTDVYEELKKKIDPLKMQSFDSALRLMMDMPPGVPRGFKRYGNFVADGEYRWMDELAVGQSRIVAFIYDVANGIASGAINAAALRMAVSRSENRTGFSLATQGTPQGLLITRLK